MAEPLHHLTCKNVAFEWSPECQAAFEGPKSRFVTPSVSVYPNFDVDFVLEIGASHQGLEQQKEALEIGENTLEIQTLN